MFLNLPIELIFCVLTHKNLNLVFHTFWMVKYSNHSWTNIRLMEKFNSIDKKVFLELHCIKNIKWNWHSNETIVCINEFRHFHFILKLLNTIHFSSATLFIRAVFSTNFLFSKHKTFQPIYLFGITFNKLKRTRQCKWFNQKCLKRTVLAFYSQFEHPGWYRRIDNS